MTEPSQPQISDDLVRVFRAESGRVLSALLVHTRDIDLAEDALQDAMVQALQQWPARGLPNNLSAWLFTVAKRRLVDRLRRVEFRGRDSTRQAIIDLEQSNDLDPDHGFPDERLRLIFTCCHPSLAREAQVALTLKTVCGLTAREIARAFLTSETTMNQRLTRAKKKIKTAGIAYQVPEAEQLPARLPSVLAVIYFIFNESYTAFEGQTLSRDELTAEAIYLAEKMHDWLPTAEGDGLLALMLLHHARKAARNCDQNAYISLAEQDRSRWDKNAISRGRQLILTTLAQGQLGPYQIQAAISALHCEAPTWQTTDWAQIALLYDQLLKFQPTPVVELNKAIALGFAGQLDLADKTLSLLEHQLANYQPFYAARGYLLAQLGNAAGAKAAYKQAIALSNNRAEKSYLQTQIDNLVLD